MKNILRKVLVLISVLLISSCAVEVREEYYYFDAYDQGNGTIRLSFGSNYDYVIVSGDKNVSLNNYLWIHHGSKHYHEHILKRLISPQYFKVYSYATGELRFLTERIVE